MNPLRRVGARSRLWLNWAHSWITFAVTVALWLLVMRDGDPISDAVVVPWWLIAIGVFVAESWVVHMHFRSESGSFSFFEIPMIVGILFTDPGWLVPAVVAGACASMILVHRRPPVKDALNLAKFSFHAAVAWVVLDLMIGSTDPLSPEGWFIVLSASMISSVVELTNIWLVVSTSEGRFKRSNWWRMLLFGVVVAGANSVQALVMALLVVVEPYSLILLGLSTTVIFASYRSYVSERDQRERVEFLYSSTRALQAAEEADAAAASLLEEAAAMFRARSVELHLPSASVDGDGSYGRILTWHEGVVDSMIMGERERAVVDHLAPHASPPVIVGDAGPLARYAAEQSFGDAMVGALTSGEGRTGLIVVANRLGNVATFMADDLQLFATLVQHAALALENDQLEHALNQLRALERELAHQASHDTLTGLANRALLNDRIVEQLQVEQPDVALIYVDLDDFKVVNDTMGHAAGDQVLIEAARRLKANIRPTDIAARLGGDEFAVVLIGADRAEITAGRILESLAAPYDVDEGRAASIGASAGLARWEPGIDATALISRADVAMYVAKEGGKGTVSVFREEMQERLSARQTLRSQLRTAVAEEQFQVLYQPIVDMQSQRIVAAEALVRWVSPDGLLLPHGFIGEAERSGLIVPIDNFVFSQVLRDFDRLDDAGHDDLWVTSNLSMRTLQEVDLVPRVISDAGSAGVATERIVLEVTETALMHDPELATNQLNRLREKGVRVALDDFGTGYSSLSYLRRFPVDILKIAQPFVSDLDDEDDTFVRAMTDLGHTLGLAVLAEGIEHNDALRKLSNLSVDLGQGYYFARPLRIEQLLELLSSEHVKQTFSTIVSGWE